MDIYDADVTEHIYDSLWDNAPVGGQNGEISIQITELLFDITRFIRKQERDVMLTSNLRYL